jgi:TPR repeat protein
VLGLAAIPLAAPASASLESFIIEHLPSEQLFYRGLFLQSRGQVADAIVAFDRSAHTDSDADLRWHRKSLAALADIYLGPGRFRSREKGLAALEEGALAEDGDAAGKLAKIQFDGNIAPHKALIAVYQKLALASSNNIALLLAKLTAEGKLGAKPKMSAFDWYTLAAGRGSSQAVRELVIAYAARGEEQKALDWIKRLNKADVASVYLDIARDFLTDGDRLKRNGEAAVAWYRRALAADPEKAVRSASRFFDESSDSDKAAMLSVLRQLADRNDPAAALFVAKLLDRGNPTAVNRDAVRYYVVAAKGGEAEAVDGLVRVSAFLKPEDTLTRDVFDGIMATANTGSVDAMLALGNLYGVGTLTERDAEESFSWYLKAAKAGSAEAEFRAGIAYAKGLGTGADMGEARRWLMAADASGYALAGPSLRSLETAQ